MLEQKFIIRIRGDLDILEGWTARFTAASIKVMLDRQDAAFAHLTCLTVWIQDHVLTCAVENEAAMLARDDARRSRYVGG